MIIPLVWPAFAALLAGLWSYGHKKRMVWTGLALFLLPVLILVPGTMLLWELNLAWRSVVWMLCGMSFVTGFAMLFVWAGAWVWYEIPAESWHKLAVWLCRGAAVTVLGAMCVGVTMVLSFLALFAADKDYTEELDGRKVVAEYDRNHWNYYAYHGPLLQGTELLVEVGP